MFRTGTLIFILSSLGGSAWLGGVVPGVREACAGQTEASDRRIDQVALQAQHKAILKIKSLLTKYKNTEKEPILLSKLSEIQQQTATLEFRVAYGEAHRLQKQPNLAKYKSMMNDTVITTTQIVQKYPNLDTMDEILFTRASCYEALEEMLHAQDDYLAIVNRFKDSNFVVQSYMALAEYAISKNLHTVAISYLEKVEQHPDDSHYPFALYKLAWSHFNLKDLAKSVEYLEKNVDYYKKASSSGPLSQSDQAMKEHSLLDIGTFFLEGYEKSPPVFTLSEALPLFKKYEDGPFLGKMVSHFAMLLRSHGHDEDLDKWKNQLMSSESRLSETLDVVALNFEYLFNGRHFDRMTRAIPDFAKLDQITHQEMRKFESYVPAQKLLLNVAERLQAMTVKNKSANDLPKLTKALGEVYEAFAQIVDESDPRIPRVHYNLAETLFQIKEYAHASENYLWVFQHWSRQTDLDRGEVLLRLISSRYQALRVEKLIQKEIKPVAVSRESQLDLGAFKTEMREWIEWVDLYRKDFSGKNPEFENFEFEANRTIYTQGQTLSAVQRLVEFFVNHPTSSFAVPSASLVLDTYIVDQRWQELYEVSKKFVSAYQKVKTKDPAFETKLASVESDAYYNIINVAYKKKDYSAALHDVESFLDEFPVSSRRADILYLGSKIAVDAQKSDQARRYLSELIEHHPKADALSNAWVARAELEEDQYDFAGASKDYRAYLSHYTAGDSHKDKLYSMVSKKALLVQWLDSKSIVVECQKPKSSEDAESEINIECDRYRALSFLKSGVPENEDPSDMTQKGIHGTKEIRALWAALALQFDTEVSFNDRLALVRNLANEWDHLDPLGKFVLVPVLSELTYDAIQKARRDLSQVTPLRASSKSISRRIEYMTEMEKTASRCLKLPWARVKVGVLTEMSQMYSDFSVELTQLKTPKDMPAADKAEYTKNVGELIRPFEQKGEKLRKQAYELASESGIERKAFERMFAEVAKLPKVESLPIDVSLLNSLDPDHSGNKFRALWSQALKDKNWGQMAFFIQELKDKGSPQEKTLKLMRALALAAAGAQAESLVELEAVKGDLDPAGVKKLDLVLYGYFLNSQALKKAESFAAEREKIKL